jgi:hypothetical protein
MTLFFTESGVKKADSAANNNYPPLKVGEKRQFQQLIKIICR